MLIDVSSLRLFLNASEETGLELSLRYDIIKAHGGEKKVETKEGEYAEFIIQLPAMIN